MKLLKYDYFLLLFCLFFNVVDSFSAIPSSSIKQTKVVVTGASGSVGLLLFKKLLKKKQFYPIALVRDNQSAKELEKLGAQSNQIVIGDIRDKSSISTLFKDANKVVLCTSAKPKKRLSFKIKKSLLSLVGQKIKPETNDLYYSKNETPWHIDFLGQKNVIDLCLESKVDHVIMLGNMGGYKGSQINEIGRNQNSNPREGNILKWKRAAERYLMKRCLNTIIHAAALTDAKGGQSEIVWDTDDSLLRAGFRKIGKEDCAEVLMQALLWKEAKSRSIDIAARENSPNGITKDWLRFFSRPGDCLYPADFDELE